MLKIRLNKKIITIVFVLIAGAMFGALAGAFIALTHDLPQIRSLETFRPDTVTRIYSANNELLAELYIEKREPVPLAVIPDHLVSALIATEDRKFYKHSGVDLKGVARAIIKDIWAGEFVEGASTITQQLAKTLFLTSRKTLVRKIKEAILAFQLERRYTKDEILELYLNQVYFGSGAYGVESAAQIFFGKSVKDLTLSECALVAGLPKSPSRYSPLINPELALQRRNIVLKQMRDTGLISEEAHHQALKEEMRLSAGRMNAAKAPYFVDHVKKFLEDKLGASQLYRGGLSVYTTLDDTLQAAAEQSVINGLTALEMRMRQQNLDDPDLQAALISLDVHSGGILAMVGGKNFMKSSFNRATDAKRQPGSAFKTFVYAYAIEQGFSQDNLILDAPVAYRGAQAGKDWIPENFSRSYEGEMTLRRALAISQNIPAVRLMEMLGPTSVMRFAHRLGIESNLAPNLSLALGTSEATLIEMTAAYAVFANMGKKIEPYSVREIKDHNGRSIWTVRPQKQLVLSRTAAAIVANMLEAVIQEGTGRKARVLRPPVAGKTGTSNHYNDALFIGFSPSVSTGVWVGRDLGGTLGDKETGAKAALPIWIEFMQAALENSPPQYFDIPDEVVQIRIDPETGARVTNDSMHAVVALFRKTADAGRP